MEQYAGIDVSLNSASVCIVDAQGKILKEAKVACRPSLPCQAPPQVDGAVLGHELPPAVAGDRSLRDARQLGLSQSFGVYPALSMRAVYAPPLSEAAHDP